MEMTAETKVRKKTGPKPKDSLLARVAQLPVKGEMILETNNQRMRAMKFARENRRLFVSRTTAQGILIWRAT